MWALLQTTATHDIQTWRSKIFLPIPPVGGFLTLWWAVIGNGKRKMVGAWLSGPAASGFHTPLPVTPCERFENHVGQTIPRGLLRALGAYGVHWCSWAASPHKPSPGRKTSGKVLPCLPIHQLTKQRRKWRRGMKWDSDPKVINHSWILVIKISGFSPRIIFFIVIGIGGMEEKK